LGSDKDYGDLLRDDESPSRYDGKDGSDGIEKTAASGTA
jgi:hypothetical protein